jgi:hypothetical protein
MTLTVEQVLALAPDAGSVSAARKLAQPAIWNTRGRSDGALWGECQGSALYQVRVDLADMTVKCSCPSRKFPCKHSLALLLLAAEQPALLPPAAAPDWVSQWLEKRAAAAAKRAEPDAARPVGEAAQAKRGAQRLTRVRAGLDALDLWMNDLVRNGLATIETQGHSACEGQAARLVDAQAPGLAARVRDLSGFPGTGAEWAHQFLGGLGLVALLTHAFARIDQLDPALQSEIRQLVGWTLKEEDVVGHGDLVEDDWIVLGQRLVQDERVRVQRTWLTGVRTGREALVLQFSAGGTTFPETFVPGTHGEAVLAFWPGTASQRALVHTRRDLVHPWSGRLPGCPAVDDFLARFSTRLGRQPWLRQSACVLCDVVPIHSTRGWFVRDAAGKALRVTDQDWWAVLALSGGYPIDVTGEWDGNGLSPLFASSPREPYCWTRDVA